MAQLPGDFVPDEYLALNADVAAAGVDPAKHYLEFGAKEGRRYRLPNYDAQRAAKMDRLEPYLRLDMAHERRGLKYDFLTSELREQTRIVDTNAVSANDYDEHGLEIINSGELVLDCGAGSRRIYYENVVNFEIVDYPSTDIIGVGEALPFLDDTFDAVISVAVLEHVRDPFRCASEIARVLKPGGRLYCCVPFLQPYHGYPHHYYNMTHQGLAAMWEDRSIDVVKQDVLYSTGPVWTLAWFLSRWADQLPELERTQFEELRIGDLLKPAQSFVDARWVKALPKEAQFELASATVLWGTKS